MVTRADVTRYADAGRAAVDAAERQLADFLANLDLAAPGAPAALEACMDALAQQYGTVVASAAAEWYEELRAADGVADGFAALVDDSINSTALRASTEYQLNNGNPDALASRLGGLLQRHILGAGRRTIDRNLDADTEEVRYARVPAGPKTCAFCTMLASRGWVYRSKERASHREQGGRYHDRCDCVIVPSWSALKPTITDYDPDAMYEQYEQARDAARSTDETVILAEMRRQHPDLYTDGVRPKRGSITVPDGLTVAPHEMDTAERLASAGMTVRFRPVDKTPGAKNPDIDLAGPDGDEGAWEMKSPKGSTENTIDNQFKRAKKQSSRMVLDLARCGLPDDDAIAQATRRFNSQSAIKEMIIIRHDGSLLRLPG